MNPDWIKIALSVMELGAELGEAEGIALGDAVENADFRANEGKAPRMWRALAEALKATSIGEFGVLPRAPHRKVPQV